MVPALPAVLFGSARRQHRRGIVLVLALGLFALTGGAYALGLFTVSGGLVWIPFYAAIVGMVAACCLGFYRGGLVDAWVVTYTSLLGYHAYSVFLGASRRPFLERLASFLRLDALGFLAVEGLVLGSVAFVVGYVARMALAAITGESRGVPSSKS